MRVTVIGAGVIGLSIAYRLAGRGCDVTVVYRTDTNPGASHNNAGWLVPGDCGPVPGPGIILQTMRWILQQGSPLYVRPSLRPDYLRFLFGMMRACNATAYRNAVDATLRLATGTLDEFDAWAADGIAYEMHAAGELRTFLTDKEFDGVSGGLDQLRRAGVEVQLLDGNGARDLVPELSDEVVHGIFYPAHRHVQPETVVTGLMRRCEALGVRFVDAAIDEATIRSSGVIELRGTAEPIEADACVVAAGFWSRQATRLFGVSLPIHAGKGYSLDFSPNPVPATRPTVMLCEAHCAVTPLNGSTRLSGTMEFGSSDDTVNAARVRAIRMAPQHYLRDWNPDASASTPTVGLRPMTPDGLPVIGRLGQHRNVFVASGHGMLGLTLAPRTAAEVVKMVVDGETPEVLAPFSPRRFA